MSRHVTIRKNSYTRVGCITEMYNQSQILAGADSREKGKLRSKEKKTFSF